MVIKGVERKFLLTAEAFCLIAEMNEYKRFDLDRLYDGKTTRESLEIDKRIAVIMSNAYQDRQELDHPNDAQPERLKLDDFDSSMTMGQMIALQQEIGRAIADGLKPEVEAETENEKNA